MGAKRSWKRAVGLAAVVAVTCGALQAATPSFDKAVAKGLSSAAREARLQTPKPRAALGLGSTSSSTTRTARASGDTLRSALPDPAQAEPILEPWSLLAGALGVALFVAGRRRAD
ncbi:MAG: hypothetical protein H7Z15_18550 [Rhizobacter sp.]|nr:hypothetical protein [Rhizobacter sp.]